MNSTHLNVYLEFISTLKYYLIIRNSYNFIYLFTLKFISSLEYVGLSLIWYMLDMEDDSNVQIYIELYN